MLAETLPNLLRRLAAIAESRPKELDAAISALHGDRADKPDPIHLTPSDRHRFVSDLAAQLNVTETDLLALYDLYLRYYKR